MSETQEIIDRLNWGSVTGGRTAGRVMAAEYVLKQYDVDLQRLRLEECADENTGRRYGEAKIRRGKAVKLGSGGRNRGSRWSYQVWLVWN